MNISVYSFIMGVIWFNAFIVLVAVLRRNKTFLVSFSLASILFVVVAGLVRLFFSFEFPFVIVLENMSWFPAVQNFFTTPFLGMDLFTVFIVLCAVWIFGTIKSISELASKHIKFLLRVKKIPVADYPDLTAKLDEVLKARNVKRRRKLQIKIDYEMTSPYTAGFFKPILFLTNSDFTEKELEDIFNHELAHLQFHDLWIKLFVRIICSVFWWNPLVSIFVADLDSMLEVKCDISVVGTKSLEERARYFQSVQNVLDEKTGMEVEAAQPFAAWLVSATDQEKLDERRELVMVYDKHNKKVRRNFIICCICTVLLFAFSYVFVIQPAYVPQPEDFADLPPSNELFVITPENSYLVDNEDGTYSVFSDNEFRYEITEERLTEGPYNALPVK